MKPLRDAEVARALELPPAGEVVFSGVSTDTRTLQPGELFVALAGERFDGHQFLEAARQAGARGAVVRRGTPPVPGLVLYPVADTLEALGRLAAARRQEIAGPVVAITGSNGKTATRALVAAALGTRWRTHATSGNLNNLVGVPLTILGAPAEAQALVIECGASLPGELARLRGIVDPTIGLVTNVGPAHLAGFGSLAGVLEEKVSLLAGVPLAIVGTRPPELAQRARQVARRVLTAGLAPGADVTPDRWHVDALGRAVLTFRGVRIQLPLVGRHQADNALLALAAACELGLELGRVAEALARVELPAGRCQVIQAGELLIVNDAYNANPASLLAALEVAQRLRGNRRLVLLLGSMLELGPESAALHRRMADEVLAIRPDLIGAVGEFVPAFADRGLGARLLVAAHADQLGRLVAARLAGDELVLLKASRGVHLEAAIPHLLRGREESCSTIC